MAKDTITLGGGCFWCLEAVYLIMEGVDTSNRVIPAERLRIPPTSRYAPVARVTPKLSR